MASRSTSAGPPTPSHRGISMVHQHFMLVPGPDAWPRTSSWARRRWRNRDLPRPHARPAADPRRSGDRFGFDIDPDEKVEQPLGRLAAAGRDPQGALSRCAHPGPRRADGRAHAPGDRGDLRRCCGGWPTQGHSIVFISHKLYEVLEIADRITVIRRGKVVGERHARRDGRGRPRGADGRPRGPADGRPRRPAIRPTSMLTVAGPRRSRTTAAGPWSHGVDVRGPRGRGPGHRRRRRQRPGRAGRGSHGPAPAEPAAASCSAAGT